VIIVGLMSGTSGDGIDAAICELEGAPPQIRGRVLKGITLPYADSFRQRIIDACQPGRVDHLCALNFEIAQLFAEAAQQVIRLANLQNTQVDLIASHGQTVWHQVEADGRVSSTLQIGEAALLAQKTGITTISNFRPRDVAAGGQGAPLTGYADWLLLRHPDHWRAVQNIGGMGNVTFLPPLSDSGSLPLAFDTGPGNVLIDGAVYALTKGQKTYDENGALAHQGKIDPNWLQQLLTHPYYQRTPPKTTGRELFSRQMAQDLVKEGQKRGLDRFSIIATLTALTARTIADAYQRFAPQPIQEVILGGGGARNPALVNMLRERVRVRVRLHEDLEIDSDFKEALVFALLAYETWHARPGNHPALTGAQEAVILGQITPGKNYLALLQATFCQP
jgi:anhydro-N-acetylmuramic acid kinase